MSRAEKFISEYTRNCSNIAESKCKDSIFTTYYIPWLTPDQARKAVEIAKDEMIDKFYNWLRSNATYIHP